MNGVWNSVKKPLSGLRLPAARTAQEIYARAAAASLLFVLSACFLFYCSARLLAECDVAPVEKINAEADVKIVDEAKELALDRLLYEDYRKAADVSLSSAGVFTPNFAVEEFGMVAGGGKLPSYMPTVILKALAVLGGESVCVLDIDGEEAGKIFREGDVFGNGRGRVVKISADGVAWRWADREYIAGL